MILNADAETVLHDEKEEGGNEKEKFIRKFYRRIFLGSVNADRYLEIGQIGRI